MKKRTAPAPTPAAKVVMIPIMHAGIHAAAPARFAAEVAAAGPWFLVRAEGIEEPMVGTPSSRPDGTGAFLLLHSLIAHLEAGRPGAPPLHTPGKGCRVSALH